MRASAQNARTASATLPLRPQLPSRGDLARAQCISRGGVANPDALLVEHAGVLLVVKDFAPRSAFVRATLGRWIARREQRAWAALAGHASVPRLIGEIDALAFAVEYRAGRPLSRSLARETPPGFFDRLAVAIDRMHALGVVHLDLRHQGNVLVGEDGAPVLIDFGSALVLAPGSLAARAARVLLGWIDHGAVRKWRRYSLEAGASSRAARGDKRPM